VVLIDDVLSNNRVMKTKEGVELKGNLLVVRSVLFINESDIFSPSFKLKSEYYIDMKVRVVEALARICFG
jgi:hypothetical protein